MSDQSAPDQNQTGSNRVRPPVPPVPPAPPYAQPAVPPAPPYSPPTAPSYGVPDTAVPTDQTYRSAPQQPPYAGTHAVPAAQPTYPVQPYLPQGRQSPQPYGHQYPAYAVQPVAPTRPSSGLAIAALVCGVAGFVLSPAILFIVAPVLVSIAAIVLGHLALSQLKKRPELGGKGIAITGLVLGYIPVAISVLLLVLALGAAVLFGAFAIPFLSS
ncbi:DUF4190 domain-containing protein [Microbacterium sp.]|uniref:DUF4190 domain-containing protein n=1 Tax=Microbacterium sp. TaxID=51671 RepID=UPI0028126FDC|nr:DUF4190 domain-containing protein [Microbacterium sp.]